MKNAFGKIIALLVLASGAIAQAPEVVTRVTINIVSQDVMYGNQIQNGIEAVLRSEGLSMESGKVSIDYSPGKANIWRETRVWVNPTR